MDRQPDHAGLDENPQVQKEVLHELNKILQWEIEEDRRETGLKPGAQSLLSAGADRRGTPLRGHRAQKR